MIYVPKYFKLYELLPKDFYEAHKTESIKLWMMFDKSLLITADRLREFLGCSIIVNTWFWGGQNQYRGWRPFDCPVGSQFSQHKFGRALDSVTKHYTAEEIRQTILANPWHSAFYYITRIEKDVSWLHVDVGNHQKHKSGILII